MTMSAGRRKFEKLLAMRTELHPEQHPRPAVPVDVEALYTFRVLDCEAQGLTSLAFYNPENHSFIDDMIHYARGVHGPSGLILRNSKITNIIKVMKKQLWHVVFMTPMSDDKSYVIVRNIQDGCSAMTHHGYKPNLLVKVSPLEYEAVWIVNKVDEDITWRVSEAAADLFGGDPGISIYLPSYPGNQDKMENAKIAKSSIERCHKMQSAVEAIQSGGGMPREPEPVQKMQPAPAPFDDFDDLDDFDSDFEPPAPAPAQAPKPAAHHVHKKHGHGHVKKADSGAPLAGLPPAHRPPMGVDGKVWQQSLSLIEMARYSKRPADHARASADEIIKTVTQKGIDGVKELLSKEEAASRDDFESFATGGE